MPMTNYLANFVLNFVFIPNGHWAALHNADPTTAGLATTEIQGGSYARQQVTWAPSNTRTTANSNALVWRNLPATTVAWIGFWDAQTGGTCVYSFGIAAQVISSGGSFTIPVNDLAVTVP